MLIFLLAYIIVGCLFTLYFSPEIFKNSQDGYNLSVITAAIICGPLALAAMAIVLINSLVISFFYRVFR